MATQDFAQQMQDYYNQQLAQAQANYNLALQNQNIGSYGGSDADRSFWQQKGSVAGGQIANLQKNLQPLMDAINSGAINSTNLDMAQKYLQGDPIAMEQLKEAVSGQQQLQSQNQQLSDFQSQMTQQLLGTSSLNNLNLADAMTSTAGSVGQLNSFLGNQEAQTFNTQLKPVIQMALGSQGLSDSGAQVELQSKALAQLEQQRQQSMMQAALGAQSQIQGLQYNQLAGGIGYAQQMQNNQFDLARTGITMQFQQALENQREQLARDLAANYGGGQGGGGLGSMIGMGVGGAAGFAMGGPGGAMMGAGLGASLGGGIGNMVSPGQSGMGLGAMGPAFMSGSSNFFQNSNQQKPPQPQYSGMSYPTQNGQYSGPMNNNGYYWQPSF